MKRQLEDYDPDDFQSEAKYFREKYETLLDKFRRRNRSPLKFVEAFENFQIVLREMETSCWDATISALAQRRAAAEKLRQQYEMAKPHAEAQRERNHFWDRLYRPTPRPYEGGRADGNS